MSEHPDDHREPVGGPDDGAPDPHLGDKAELESRDRAQPSLIGEQANLRADEPDDTEALVAEERDEREAILDEVEEERRG